MGGFRWVKHTGNGLTQEPSRPSTPGIPKGECRVINGRQLGGFCPSLSHYPRRQAGRDDGQHHRGESGAATLTPSPSHLAQAGGAEDVASFSLHPDCDQQTLMGNPPRTQVDVNAIYHGPPIAFRSEAIRSEVAAIGLSLPVALFLQGGENPAPILS